MWLLIMIVLNLIFVMLAVVGEVVIIVLILKMALSLTVCQVVGGSAPQC